MIPFISHCQGRYTLKLIAGPDTSLAADAFAVILDDRWRKIVNHPAFAIDQVDEHMIANPVFMRQALQFAVTILIAFGAVSIMF
jgi:hypothetical protein